MRIYRLTEIGDSEASSPVSNPTDARRILYYLRRRGNHAASDDMIANAVFENDKSKMNMAISKLLKANAIQSIGG